MKWRSSFLLHTSESFALSDCELFLFFFTETFYFIPLFSPCNFTCVCFTASRNSFVLRLTIYYYFSHRNIHYIHLSALPQCSILWEFVIKLVWTWFLIYLSLPIKTLYPFLLSPLFLLYPAQYFATTMVIVGLSVIATVLVLQYHHHDPDGDKMPKWVSIISLHTIICELYCNPLNVT